MSLCKPTKPAHMETSYPPCNRPLALRCRRCAGRRPKRPKSPRGVEARATLIGLCIAHAAMRKALRSDRPLKKRDPSPNSLCRFLTDPRLALNETIRLVIFGSHHVAGSDVGELLQKGTTNRCCLHYMSDCQQYMMYHVYTMIPLLEIQLLAFCKRQVELCHRAHSCKHFRTLVLPILRTERCRGI